MESLCYSEYKVCSWFHSDPITYFRIYLQSIWCSTLSQIVRSLRIFFPSRPPLLILWWIRCFANAFPSRSASKSNRSRTLFAIVSTSIPLISECCNDGDPHRHQRDTQNTSDKFSDGITSFAKFLFHIITHSKSPFFKSGTGEIRTLENIVISDTANASASVPHYPYSIHSH